MLYGSETGNAHDVAERIAREATRRSYAATVRAMDAYDVTALPSAGRAVFVTSTMGQGDPPANVRAFWRFLLRKNLPANSLAGLAFACFGLGDSHYRQYNVVAKRLHKRLLGLGARSVADLGLGDDQHPSGYDAALDPWLETLWERMRDDVVTRDAPSAPPSARADPDADPEDERKFDAEILQQPPREEEGGESSAADSSSAVAASAMLDAALGLDRVERLAERGAHARDGSNPEPSRRYAPATALRNDALTAPDAVTETRHVELALEKQKCPQGVFEPSSSRLSSSASDPDFNDSYAPGDCLAVLPLPDPGDVAPGASSARARAVAEVLRRAGVAPDALVAVSPRRRGAATIIVRHPPTTGFPNPPFDHARSPPPPSRSSRGAWTCRARPLGGTSSRWRRGSRVRRRSAIGSRTSPPPRAATIYTRTRRASGEPSASSWTISRASTCRSPGCFRSLRGSGSACSP